jgi:soluble lytic murein transglycosylase-like protein
MKRRCQVRDGPNFSGWSVVAIAYLALGVSSFAAPLAERFRSPDSQQPPIESREQPIESTQQPIIAKEPPIIAKEQPTPAPYNGCSATAKPAVDRDAAIAESIAYFQVRRSTLTQTEIRRVAETLVDCAAFYEIEPALVIAVIHVESRGNAFARSPVGALGLMQIMPPTGEELAGKLGIRWVGSKLLFEPEINVRLGIAYLRELRQRFGNWPTALAAYNWGPALISQRLRTGAALPVVYSTSVLDAKHRNTGI